MELQIEKLLEKLLRKKGLRGAELERAMVRERRSETWKPMPFHHPQGTLCNGANKLYSLRMQLTSGETLELCKAKGMSKGLFRFEDYAAMFDEENPQPLTQAYQTQFKLGLSGYCVDGGIKPIMIRHLPKVAHAKYDKGQGVRGGVDRAP